MLWKNEISWDFSLRWISARWRHQMKIFSALLAFCAGNSPVTGEFPHKSQWHGALMFSLIGAWMDDWVNNYEAGDLRRHRTHYDVTVMERNPKLQEPQGPISTIGSFLICVVMKDTTLYLTHPPPPPPPPWRKWPISQTTFTNDFFSGTKTSFAYWFKFHWSLFLMVQMTIIGSDNGLAPYRRQAILSETMMVSLLTHIWVTRRQWVNTQRQEQFFPRMAASSFQCGTNISATFTRITSHDHQCVSIQSLSIVCSNLTNNMEITKSFSFNDVSMMTLTVRSEFLHLA